MGITVHFTGRAADRSHVGSAIDAALAAAEARGWAAQQFARESATLRRSSEDREWECTGPTDGVVVTPHEMCELQANRALRGPLRLENGRILDLVEVDGGDAAPPEPWWRFW